MDDGVGGGQVQAHAPGFQTQQQHRHLLCLEALHHAAALCGRGGAGHVLAQPLPFVEKQRAKNARDKRPQLGQHFGDVLRRTEARIDDRQPRISRYAVDDVPRHQPRKVGRLANRAD